VFVRGGQALSPVPVGSTTAAATTTAATTAAGTTAPSRLTKDQFTKTLKDAGWAVGVDAYTTAVRMCATETSDTDIKHLAELADPNASDKKIAIYVEAVHDSC
jgi:hypothetical protein